ncbi:MAG: sulfite exporter TauE/SafE family protein [Euryarchaeota archaeon]|nr:sulfite exporter TauE/SafE family protein [Euryarchaeota archaeon]
MDTVILLVLVLTTLGIAAIYTNIGLGGGVMHVPILMWVAGLDKNSAVAVSLSLVLGGAIAASASHMKERMVEWRLAGILSAGAVIGAIFGSVFNLGLDPTLFKWLFILMIFLVCVRFAYDVARGKDCVDECKTGLSRGQSIVTILVAVGAGFVSSMFGIGGGLIYVPLMMYYLRRQAKVSAFTSTVVIIPTSLVGLMTYLVGGRGVIFPDTVYWDTVYYILALAPLAVIGGYMGSRLAVKRFGTWHIKAVFLVLALLVAVVMIYQMLL